MGMVLSVLDFLMGINSFGSPKFAQENSGPKSREVFHGFLPISPTGIAGIKNLFIVFIQLRLIIFGFSLLSI
jgi:hypothetical protein